ncbi:EAL domain-containing protein [Pseudomonas sp. NW5]|uniref:putative bifunctional diguanylate cyclase/phosphodiesterase n=1 Tax=Pseudomonas sp. NW5 TaxID=2934934 RepID=UPI00201FEB42|nr:EAL domain-containing protein [Pseudomonas sp. NW5]MCL7461158.1 EAL domain-containing protein [Pseudomonas sp. NW5]
MNTPSAIHASARILVIDDKPVNVELLLDMLEDAGYENLEGLSDPRQVEPLLEEGLPDLLLLDIRMPHLDGHQILTRLQARWGEQAPPVIVLSAQTDRDTRLQSLALGARDFISKPFDQHEVLQRLHNTLQAHFLLRERSNQARQLQDLIEERTVQIQRLAREDPLTGLPNRTTLLELIEQQRQAQRPFTLCYLDFAGLSEISRLHGQASSECLLLTLRERLHEWLDPEAQLGVWRYSAWVLCLPGPLAALRIEALLERLHRPLQGDSLSVRLDVRVGVSHSQMPHDSAEHLLRMAALAVAEERGRWQLYQPSLEAALQRRDQYHQALHQGVEQQLFMVYQPKIDLVSGRVIGAEALLRWQHPQWGLVPPGEFIPLAESSGDILNIGQWVIEQAIRQLEQWFSQALLPRDFRLAVNVASLQLVQPHFARLLLERLRHSQLPQGALEIEITESGLMRDIDLARQQLKVLADEGLSIAVDDFGTGYSSLAYLKTLPVSVLKIDRAFIQDMDNNPQDLRLTETVVQMARSLGLGTVAEGVERSRHVTLLHHIGCQLGQGFWYSPPLRAEEFITFCRRQNSSGEHLRLRY